MKTNIKSTYWILKEYGVEAHDVGIGCWCDMCCSGDKLEWLEKAIEHCEKTLKDMKELYYVC